VKAKQKNMDAIKDCLIPHIYEKKMVNGIFDALVSLYQSDIINRKMTLRNKLRSIGMTRSNSIVNYLMKVTQIRDQLGAIGEKVANTKLVNMALNGFPTSWEPFVKGICAHENLPNFERCGMIISKRKLKWSQRPTRRVVTRTYPCLVRQIGIEVKDPTRVREIVRIHPHNQLRRT
jgi:hypothetical protein